MVGDYNNVHTHDGSHISGVLYIDDGGDPTACTKFYDVRGQRAEPPLGPGARRADVAVQSDRSEDPWDQRTDTIEWPD